MKKKARIHSLLQAKNYCFKHYFPEIVSFKVLYNITSVNRHRYSLTKPIEQIISLQYMIKQPIYAFGILCKQHFLNFFPLPHGHGSFLPILGTELSIVCTSPRL